MVHNNDNLHENTFSELLFFYSYITIGNAHTCFSVITGVGHNIESGKDFTVDGLSGFSKKKKKKRRHR